MADLKSGSFLPNPKHHPTLFSASLVCDFCLIVCSTSVEFDRSQYPSILLNPFDMAMTAATNSRLLNPAGVRVRNHFKENQMLNATDNRELLIVKDNDSLRDRLAIAMEKRGFTTHTAASVVEGLSAIK